MPATSSRFSAAPRTDRGPGSELEPPAQEQQRGSFRGIIRLIFGILVSLPSGYCTAVGLPTAVTEDWWSTEDYVLLLTLGILPFIAGICLIWAGWATLRKEPSTRTTVVTVVSLILISISFVSCSAWVIGSHKIN